VGVHLTTSITSNHVHFSLIHETYDLNVIRGFRELDPRDGTVNEDTTTMTWLCAPGNHLTLNFADGASGRWRTPETEIYQGALMKPEFECE
jgi:hypothetical protein